MAGSIIGSELDGFARSNRLVLITWQHLLEIQSRIAAGTYDSINFWCSLFETDGLFELDEDYDWTKKARVYSNIFSVGRYLLDGGPDLLKRAPEK